MSAKQKTYQVRGEVTHRPAIDLTELCNKILIDELNSEIGREIERENLRKLNKEIITKIDEYYETKNNQ